MPTDQILTFLGVIALFPTSISKVAIIGITDKNWRKRIVYKSLHFLRLSIQFITFTFRSMLSPILRRLCVSSKTSSIASCDEVKNQEKKNDINEHSNHEDFDDIPDEDTHENEVKEKIEGKLENQPSVRQRPVYQRQETLTKDEARKRMMSWRKTVQPRSSVRRLNQGGPRSAPVEKPI